jgi:hypothetical protein
MIFSFSTKRDCDLSAFSIKQIPQTAVPRSLANAPLLLRIKLGCQAHLSGSKDMDLAGQGHSFLGNSAVFPRTLASEMNPLSAPVPTPI